MATENHKQNTHPPIPEEDYLYRSFLRDLRLAKPPGPRPVGVALFGAGRAGTVHLASLARNPRVDLLYVVEDARSKWAPLRDHWNLRDARFLAGADAGPVYEDDRVDAVVVASPTPTHEGIVLGALERRKAVFCEKPIAEDIGKASRCYEMAERTGTPLFCGFNRRFDPSYAAVHARVRAGEVGRVQVVKTCSRDCPMPSVEYVRNSAGYFQDSAVHDLDLIVWIVGEYPARITVTATANVPEIAAIGDYDTAVIVMSFPSGAISVTDLSRSSSYGYDQRLEVYGDKGMVKVENQRPTPGVEVHVGQSGPRKAPIWYNFASRYRESYANEMEHFLDVVQGLDALRVDPRDTLAVGKIAEACAEAARTGKPVEMRWEDGEPIPNE